MRYINPRFTYLLTYLITYLKEGLRWEGFAEKEGLSLEWKSEGVMEN